MVNEWTYDDLPSLPDVLGNVTTQERGEGAAAYRTAALAHLNAHYRKPDSSGVDWKAMYYQVRSERDTAVARAEAAERELADEYSEANQKAAAWDRVAAHPALKMDLLPEADHTYAGGVFERITWLAEAAEDSTAVPLHQPDGTRMDASHLPIDADDDPAVFVVLESDIAAVGIERDKDQGWTIPGRGWGWVWHSTAEELRNYARENCDRAAACEAVARAIEAEQAVDPPDGHDVIARAGTVWLDSIDHTPDEAVDLARALLAAAEEARDGADR